jgi:hypothetical protein
MDPQPNRQRRGDEYRRYFPDWTCQSLVAGEELEADHNSYLAGGYAEEFGYLAQADSSRGVPVLDGESPDDCAVRLVQWAALHPGYPLRAYPIGPDGAPSAARPATYATPNAVSYESVYDVGTHGRFVCVTERPYERQHREPAHRATATVTRFLAALVALRWRFPALR